MIQFHVVNIIYYVILKIEKLIRSQHGENVKATGKSLRGSIRTPDSKWPIGINSKEPDPLCYMLVFLMLAK